MNLPHHPSRCRRLLRKVALSTVVCLSGGLAVSSLHAQTTPAVSGAVEDLEAYGAEDPNYILPTQPIESAFGFSKPVLETPRSISVVSSEMIDKMALSAVEDLVRVVPGAYTTTRFGIQGGIDVRNVPSDTYFRGMKRINLQGHGRSVLAAMDTIEVVKGPPSPIYGMGKIGGYTNMVPKAGRAKTGAYLKKDEGVTQITMGTYDKMEFTAGVGGPLDLGKKQGGYYVYGLLEDSKAYVIRVPVKQKILQSAVSVEDAIGPFRMETGFSYQLSATAGAFPNRLTQGWVDDGDYISGSPLVNPDLNGNGKIGFYEYNKAVPVRGTISGNNHAFAQTFNWPKDSAGNYIPIGQFPVKAGIPESMMTYLNANPAADPSGLLRAQGIGGVVPTSGFLPIGFVLDPRTISFTKVDYRRAGAFERELEAEFIVAYLDFIYDKDPDFTVKNQMFFDSQDQYKWSETPSGGKQDVYIVEDKLTATKRFSKLPDWIALNTLASANFRHTRSTGYRYGGDFGGGNRVDVMFAKGEVQPSAAFVHPFENPDINNDGAPWTSNYRTAYWEAGVGVLFDADLWKKFNLLVGGRMDGSGAKNVNFASFNANAGTSANPGRATAEASSKGFDSGTSWSASLSYRAPFNTSPYFTAARSSLTLESNNNSLSNTIIPLGHVGQAQILEGGIKSSLLKNKLFVTVAVYEQTRTSVSALDDSSLLGAEVTSTITRGAELEVKWVPNQTFSLSGYATSQRTLYDPVRGFTVWVDARTLGFKDVKDAAGNVIYPAEAFGYGGKLNLVVPTDLAQALYSEQQGSPNTQLGFNAFLTLKDGLAFTFSGNYFSSVHSGQLQTILLPESLTFNAGVSYKFRNWRVKFDVFNLTDELYFRARSGGGSEQLITVSPDRRYQFALTKNF